MKKTFLLKLLLLTTSALSLSGCSLLFRLVSNLTAKENITTLSKADIEYTYRDYTKNSIYSIDSAPSTGDVKLLVIPVWFNDSNEYISTMTAKNRVISDIEKVYFGDESETGWHSVSSYYKEESRGKLTLSGTVSNWYECGRYSSYYYTDSRKTCELVESAVEWYKMNYSISYMKQFDSDSNGFLDGVMLIYAAPDYATMNNENASNMWAYCYWLQKDNANVSNPTPNTFFWASYDFMYGPTSGVGKYRGGDTSYCSVDAHTYIHEMGHVFGLSDYYDYSGSYSPAGGFTMQDYNVGGHDPYSVMALGWTKPYIPSSSCQVELKPFQDSGEVILLTNKSVNSVFDEYLLLEYYTPTGLNEFDHKHQYQNKYPTGPSKSGIRLWHVDARLISLYPNNEQGTVTITNKIEINHGVTHLMTNTYYSEEAEGYISPLGKDYANYNLLQLIRNSKTETNKNSNLMDNRSLFTASSSFSSSNMAKQFVKSGRFNSGSSIGWSFKVNKIETGRAVITLKKG